MIRPTRRALTLVLGLRPVAAARPRQRPEGRAVFAARCAACHGEAGQGGAADLLVGRQGTLASGKLVRMAGSVWTYTTTLFDSVGRAMPFDAPPSLSDAGLYAVSAYLPHLVRSCRRMPSSTRQACPPWRCRTGPASCRMHGRT